LLKLLDFLFEVCYILDNSSFGVFYKNNNFRRRLVMKNDKKKSGILGRSRPLTEEEKKELLVRSVERVKPYLDALEEWRRRSLDSKFCF